MRANGTTARVKAVAKLTGKSAVTIWRWVRQGCDLNSPASISEYLEGNKLRQHPNLIRKPTTKSVRNGTKSVDEVSLDLDRIELGPIGKRGAAAALQRLETMELSAHARMLKAIESGDQFKIKRAQEFFLQCVETLRRLDLAVEIERRSVGEQVPKSQVELISTQISQWMREAVKEFLSSEAQNLMGMKDLGECKLYFIERFKAILHRTVKASIAKDSPIPPWALAQVIKAWNILMLSGEGEATWQTTNTPGGCPWERQGPSWAVLYPSDCALQERSSLITQCPLVAFLAPLV